MNDYSFKMVLENKQKDMEKKLITNKTNIIQARVSARFFGLLLIMLSHMRTRLVEEVGVVPVSVGVGSGGLVVE